jgi:tripartite-type tricarboxylate transporter receptor subunit TctC
MKFLTRATILALMLTVTLSIIPVVHSADYPDRAITYINPYAPGASTDALSRFFTKELEKILSVNINVENKPGGSATVGTSAVVLAKPDGYTIGLSSNSAIAFQPLVNKTLPYKTPDDYQPILNLVNLPSLLYVRADAPWKTFEEFMIHVRKNPGKVRVAVAGKRTGADLTMQELNRVAGVKIVTVPFSGGGGEGLISVLARRVEADCGKALTILGHVKSGEVRILGVFKKGKYDIFPTAESVVDSGYNVSVTTKFGVLAPKGLPKNALDKLVDSSMKVGRSSAFIKFCQENGFQVDLKGPEEMRKDIYEEIATYENLLKVLDKK